MSVDSSNQLIPLRNRPVRRTDYELAFLPAALEITETPPSPIGRAIGATIIAIFSVALIWACLGSVDVVSTAPGKIIPTGRTKLLQPFETGVVRAIHVHDGQHVKAGDVLIELDPTMAEAEQTHLKGDLLDTKLEIARLRAALAGNATATDFKPPAGATPAQIEMQAQFLTSQTTEQNAKLAEIDRQRAQKEAERDTINAGIEKLHATIPPLQERVNVRKDLFDRGLGSKLLYLTEYQDLIGQQQDLNVQESRLSESTAAIAALQESRGKTVAEYQRGLYDDLAKAEQKATGIAQDLIRAARRTNLQRLTAPIDGVVQQLAVHTVGGVVTPAQPLAVVVPLGADLEVEATLSNHDIGFVHAGQSAEIKVDTFNFTRYGLLHGDVLDVSEDAIPQNKSQDASPNSPTTGRSDNQGEAKGQQLDYIAHISLDRTQMQVDDKLVNLGPGMAVTIEIKTGRRKIIGYLLSPLLRYKQEVLRER